MNFDLQHQKVDEAGSEVAWDMAGFSPELEVAFRAAAFLTGRETVSLERMRRALWEEDGDTEAAALNAYDLLVDDSNRQALRSVMELESFRKDEQTQEAIDIKPGHEDASEAAEEIQRAALAHSIQPVSLNGKHSKGALVAKDPETDTVYILKPGSGKVSPARGVNQEKADQSRREAAFWYVADEIGLGNFVPRADLILVNGKEYAAIKLLPYDFKLLQKRIDEDPNYGVTVMSRYLKAGVLHKWAVLDAILGNPDRHARNIMAGPRGEIMLIDHGSAFAGSDFDPAGDRDSFVPYYLRAWYPNVNFNRIDASERLQLMPRVDQQTADVLKIWLENILPVQIERILKDYGINPEPVLERLEQLRFAIKAKPVDQAINEFWATT